MSAKIDTECLRRAAWSKCLMVTNYRMRTARVLTDKQRAVVLAEKNREASIQAGLVARLLNQMESERSDDQA